MAPTVRDVLDDAEFSRTRPELAAGVSGLDNIVRWAYTNERYDVASFLSGGELLIIEGRALLAHMNDDEIVEYVDTLVDAGVSGVAIELVQGIREVPAAMVRQADARGLPVIGMRVRRPFVDLCQSINTAIVRGRFLYRAQLDILSNDLHRRLSKTKDADAFALVLSSVFGENVTIFDAGCRSVAVAGKERSDAGMGMVDGPTLVFDVRSRGVPLAGVEMTQRTQIFESGVRDMVAKILQQELPHIMHVDAKAAVAARLMHGPNRSYAARSEVTETSALLRALGVDGCSVFFPFAMVMRSPATSLVHVSRLIGLSENNGVRVPVCMLEGGRVVGLLADCDPGSDGEFSLRCHDWLRGISGREDVWTLAGKVATDARSLLNSIGLLRTALDMQTPVYGYASDCIDTVLPWFAAGVSTAESCAMLTGLMLSGGLSDDDVLLETLAVYFDVMGNKTEACSRLGIRRQTLYNRLDKVAHMTGVAREDGETWSLMLFAAKLARTMNMPNPHRGMDGVSNRDVDVRND